ncbi:MAG TPA: hypothetical protein VN702_04325 [Acetobacteraceae bacterium]|nr:hypothetical protein [Acetobacteraceae bacterium]
MTPRRLPLLGLLLALLALSVQLAAGAVVPPAEAVQSLAVTGAICHSGDTPTDQTPAAPHHPAACLLCPVCATLASHAAPLPLDGPILPPPRSMAIALASPPPPATAPPPALRGDAQPRAPPVLV